MSQIRWVLIIALIALTPIPALALPPPDFIFNFFAHIGQIIVVALVVVSTGFGTIIQFFKSWWSSLRHKKSFIVIFSLFIFSLTTGVYYWIEKNKADLAYQKWREREMQANLEKSKGENIELRLQLEQLKKQMEAKDNELKSAQFELIAEDVPESVEKGRVKKGYIYEKPELVKPEELSGFYKENISTPLMISNQSFKALLESKDDKPFIIDARENIEYEVGHFPGAHHFRFAELKHGAWKKLPKDKTVIVFCYSSLRGSEVVYFLRSKGILARFLEEGVKGWTTFGGQWQGETRLTKKYTKTNHRWRMGKVDFKRLLKKKKPLVIDARDPKEFTENHHKKALNISVLHMNDEQLEKKYSEIQKPRQILVVCSDHWSCFDAYIVGIELEKRGHTYIGRYSRYKVQDHDP